MAYIASPGDRGRSLFVLRRLSGLSAEQMPTRLKLKIASVSASTSLSCLSARQDLGAERAGQSSPEQGKMTLPPSRASARNVMTTA
jgi:hypothetical protein